MKKAAKRPKNTKRWINKIPKPLIVMILFGVIGVGYLMYQTFASSLYVNYYGVLTKQNPTAKYELSTGSGDMTVNFSNNTADHVLTIRNSAKQVVSRILSIGKKDVIVKLKVPADTYSFVVSPVSGQATEGRKGYSVKINYPVVDSVKPVVIIKAPLTSQSVTGIVDFTVDARDDTKVSKVELYVNSALHSTLTAAPYSAKWDTTKVANGTYTLSAKAFDNNGNVGSASGQVTVENAIATKSRFPGDPNTKLTGKAYWGASGANIAEHEQAAGASVAIHRSFSPSWPGTTRLVNAVRDDHAKNRLPWISTKTPGWRQFASGTYDAEIDAFLKSIDSAAGTKPVWLTIHHEPENDSAATGDYSVANYRAMQSKIRERMKAVGTKNIAFMPIFQGFSWQTTKWNIDEFYVAGIWDAIGFDHYSDNADQNLVRDRYAKTVSWIEAKGLPFAVGEFGVRDYGNAAQQAKEIRDFWEWGFTNKKDGIGYSYFDSPLNAPDGTWELDGARQDVWRDILKNDSRVQRLDQLKN